MRKWLEQNGENDEGIDALVFALQHVMEGQDVTYLFEGQELFPVARFPNYVSEREVTVLFNDRECHLQIASLEEFVAANNIGQHALEALDLSQLRERMTGTAERSSTADASPAKARTPSITIERQADPDGRLSEELGAAEIAQAASRSGFNVAAADVGLESPLENVGLYRLPVKLDAETDAELCVWVVPSAEPTQ